MVARASGAIPFAKTFIMYLDVEIPSSSRRNRGYGIYTFMFQGTQAICNVEKGGFCVWMMPKKGKKDTAKKKRGGGSKLSRISVHQHLTSNMDFACPAKGGRCVCIP